MSDSPYPWPYYADLQKRSRQLHRTSDYWWGMERALDHILDLIATGTVPADPDELVTALNRVIASGARLHRSRSAALAEFAPIAEPASADDTAAEARIELARIVRLVSTTDEAMLVDAGFGYTDREIADRRGSTPGAIRVRLSRIRLKLVA
jgi:DNA-binding NarL/FixJ family response regulator